MVYRRQGYEVAPSEAYGLNQDVQDCKDSQDAVRYHLANPSIQVFIPSLLQVSLCLAYLGAYLLPLCYFQAVALPL